jgi:hypothetical protein
MVTSDLRTPELLALLTTWSLANENAAGDVIATPFKYGKQDYFDFVKEATKKKAAKLSVVQVSSFEDAEFNSSEPYNLSYVQMDQNEGIVS